MGDNVNILQMPSLNGSPLLQTDDSLIAWLFNHVLPFLEVEEMALEYIAVGPHPADIITLGARDNDQSYHLQCSGDFVERYLRPSVAASSGQSTMPEDGLDKAPEQPRRRYHRSMAAKRRRRQRQRKAN